MDNKTQQRVVETTGIIHNNEWMNNMYFTMDNTVNVENPYHVISYLESIPTNVITGNILLYQNHSHGSCNRHVNTSKLE